MSDIIFWKLCRTVDEIPQAHDMLKKNADGAWKLAMEGTLALETYQKQVRMLEERNMGTIAKQAA